MYDTPAGIELYTISLSKWRKAKELNIPLLDITYKSGVESFAPSGAALGAYKRGILTDEAYTKLYINKMRNSLIENPDDWNGFLLNKRVAIACYCKAGIFCHRHILKDLLVKYGKYKNVNVILMGELDG